MVARIPSNFRSKAEQARFDDEGFDLFERYAASLKRMLSRTLHNPTDVEDVMQEAFIRAFTAPQPSKDFSFHVWLHRIAFNRALDLRRAQLRRRESAAVDRIDARTPEDIAIDHETTQSWRDAIAEMQVRERAALTLFLRGFSRRELEEAGFTSGDVKKLQSHLRERLGGATRESAERALGDGLADDRDSALIDSGLSELVHECVVIASAAAALSATDPLGADNRAMELESRLAELFVFRDFDSGFAMIVNALQTTLRYRQALLGARQLRAIADVLRKIEASLRIDESAAIRILLDLQKTGLTIVPTELEALADIG